MSISCTTDPKTETSNDLLSYRAVFSIQPILHPVAMGDSVVFNISQTDSSKHFDSISYQMDGQVWGKIKGSLSNSIRLSWDSKEATTGTHVFSITGLSGKNEPESASQTFFIQSDKAPESYTFEVVKTLPHDPESFTQGLEWQGSQLYEGTGLNGKSAVMQIDPASGKSLIRKDLESAFFGEGITIMDGKLFQITWQNKKGFVYQLPGLEKIKEFGYATDGWGLTHWNGKLAMTEGSNKIFFLNPSNFSQTGKLEVWDHKNPVEELNELEEIDGFIYANKYRTDTIVKIDPKSGKVMAYINLAGILPEKDRTGDEDVLNGIAWRPDEKLMYVTGKNWPKMFAIRMIKKQSI